MVTLFEEKKDCYGCTACLNICPKSAVNFISDKEGFLYPVIDSKKCIECNLCKKVCPFNEATTINDEFFQPRVFGVKHKINAIRFKSSSGGMFTALSDEILNRGGVVYGAVFNNNLEVCHHRASNKIYRDKFRGSKYVQSNLDTTFKNIKIDLQNGLDVLFSGTPCQNAGLSNFLSGIQTNKLILCDIICHGTPSPGLWKKYIEYLEYKYKNKLDFYSFRHKTANHIATTVNIQLTNGRTVTDPNDTNLFSNIFYSHLALRPSCHYCKYANIKRQSDITIGDFWGIEKIKPEFDDGKGISLVLINTVKGMNLFDCIKQTIEYFESNTTDCTQPNLVEPTVASPERDHFWADFQTKSLRCLAIKYNLYDSRFKKIKKAIKRFVSNFQKQK